MNASEVKKTAVIGLTGGIASGKSSVLRWLIAQGCPVCDSDQISREVVQPGEPAWLKIKSAFGESYFLADGKLDRKRLAERIFSNTAARERLNAIVHPAVAERLQRAVCLHRAEPSESRVHMPLILDIPLLFEAKLEYLADQIWLVWLPPQIQLQRLMQRDSLSLEAATERLAAQMPLQEKCALADVIIDNSGTWPETEARLQMLRHHLC